VDARDEGETAVYHIRDAVARVNSGFCFGADTQESRRVGELYEAMDGDGIG